VAVYRIVADALETVARRTGGGAVDVAVVADGTVLRVDVHASGASGLDEGRGRTDLASQRERAEELGGTWSAQEDEAGARISAVLPVT